MDEMTAFERQLSAELGQMAGPGRRIDGMAMVSAVSTWSPERRFQAMFSATKFVVAGAVVALIGGFLLVGMPSQPRADDLAPAASAPSSDPPRLVYMLDGNIYVAEEDGTEPVRIVDGDADAECGELGANRGLVSPDGRHIAYRSEWNDDCPGTVFIADLDGQVVASVPGAGWDIAWAPDGRRFATWISFMRSIGVYGIDGSLQAELDGSSVFSGGDHDPRWTPDGTALLLPADSQTAGISQALVARLPLDGGEPEIVPATDPLSIRSVSFSPDGTHVASEGPDEQLVVAALDGTPAAVEFFFEPGDRVDGGWARLPLWSPNGDQIAVVVRRWSTDTAVEPQSASLWVVDPTTGLGTTVDNVDGAGYLEPVAFSPDGERILVQKVDADGTSNLTSVASDGSGSTVIVAGADVGMWVPSSRAEDDPIRP